MKTSVKMQTNHIKTKWLAIGIILLFVGIAYAPAIAQNTEKPVSTSRGNWLYVGGGGPGNYSRIQDAIDNASDGDTVFVFKKSSPYKENIQITKSITLTGEQNNLPAINPKNESDTILKIMSSNVTFCFFRLSYTNSFHYGISVFNPDYIVTDVIITNITVKYASVGIYIENASVTIENNILQYNLEGPNIRWKGGIIAFNSSVIIKNNTINHNSNGVNLWNCKNSIIINNNISESYDIGISLISSSRIMIKNNNLEENSWGLIAGINLFLKILENNFVNNIYFNVRFTDSYFCFFSENYWDDWNGTGPKVISGQIFTFAMWHGFSWHYFDWRPAKEPYDIYGIL
jgi:parallel beta-helix repeat protein